MDPQIPPLDSKPVPRAAHLSADSSLFGVPAGEEEDRSRLFGVRPAGGLMDDDEDDGGEEEEEDVTSSSINVFETMAAGLNAATPRSTPNNSASALSSTFASCKVISSSPRSPLKTQSPRSLSSPVIQDSPRRRARASGMLASLKSPFGSVRQSVSVANPRATLFANRLARRSTTRPENPLPTAHIVQRRYNTGDYVLIQTQSPQSPHSSSTANLVNMHGFPAGEGDTADEQRGPYLYVLGTVQQIHFDEMAPYYTVTRCDTGNEERADNAYMEPVRTARGQVAAARAAAGGAAVEGNVSGTDPADGDGPSLVQWIVYLVSLPFLWLYDGCSVLLVRYLQPFAKVTLRFVRYYASAILNGRDPFVCRVRLTIVNLLVLCSTWFMFMDQIRLAFLPASADHTMAVIDLVVWMVLALELIFEVFIRPDGYRELIISDKAYAPTTVRFLNFFHLVVETASLVLFVPEFYCLWRSESCSTRYPFSLHNAVLISIIGPTRKDALYGKAYLALMRLRVFGLVRHWKNMWITNTFINMKWKMSRGGFVSMIIPSRGARTYHDRKSLERKGASAGSREDKIKELTLINASNIGTALMVTNSYRALAILWAITGLFPVFLSLSSTAINDLAEEMTKQLQATNLMATDTSNETCQFLHNSVTAWTKGLASHNYQAGKNDLDEAFLMTLDIQPYRCGFKPDLWANLYECEETMMSTDEHIFHKPYIKNETAVTVDYYGACTTWDMNRMMDGAEAIAEAQDIRDGSVLFFPVKDIANFTDSSTGITDEVWFSVEARFDYTYLVKTASMSSFLVQIFLLVSVLGGLSFLRRDAELLVLGPLRRMLKIVARYAKNPLIPPRTTRSQHVLRRKMSSRNISSPISEDSLMSEKSDGDDDDDLALGNYETERLITAVSKITDLLRKCWGVAGADIISTNLATREGALTEVFNPTVPGKSVYALFAFAAINGFDHALRNLGGDIMALINDVAKVLHDEVFRWGFGESGQCNKNLGGAFLMVFRIGLVEEVIEKLEQAEQVIFSPNAQKEAVRHRRVRSNAGSHHMRKTGSISSSISTISSKRKTEEPRRDSAKAMSLSLQSLPGISTFTDRAVIGMLKSFAGIYRDRKILKWNNDFRLGAGVGAFRASLIYGMDAGWAVEGAVGSEYKIDATYLSPHVNMASRMMSACKQYGVNIMLSEAVQELMSDAAQSKLRHLDTVTVKGSSVKQRIYTYDCRAKGVDFFLYGRMDDQADIDAERYSPSIWFNDQDLKAMGQHVTDDFLKQFRDGHKAYLSGDWPTAIKLLEQANTTMFETAVEEGYLEDEFDELQIYAGDFTKAADDLKRENGDGPSIYLINFMKSYGGKAPDRWEGWHPLTRK